MSRSELRWVVLLFLIPFVILASIPIRRLFTDRQTAQLVAVVKVSDGFRINKSQEAKGFLKSGADPNALIEGKTPLIRHAARKFDLKMVQVLQEGGAKIDDETQKSIGIARDKQHIEELCNAIKEGNVTGANRQINAGVNIDATNREGQFPLQIAIENNEAVGAGMVLTLLKNGANVHRKTAGKDGLDLVPLALYYGGDSTIFSALQKAGAVTNPQSALTITVIKNDLKGVEKWLKAGVNVEAKASPQDWTPLQWAASAGHSEIVALLLKHGANPHLKDSTRDNSELRTALQIAQDYHGLYNTAKAYDRTIAILERAEKAPRKQSLTVKKHVTQ